MKFKLDLKNKKQLAAVLGAAGIVVIGMATTFYLVVKKQNTKYHDSVTTKNESTEQTTETVTLKLFQPERPDVEVPSGAYTWQHSTGIDDVFLPLVEKYYTLQAPEGFVVYLKSDKMVLEKYPDGTKVTLNNLVKANNKSTSSENSSANLGKSPNDTTDVSEHKKVEEGASDNPSDSKSKTSESDAGGDAPTTNTSKTQSSDNQKDEIYLIAKVKFSSDKDLIVRWHKRDTTAWLELAATPEGAAIYRAGQGSSKMPIPLALHGDGTLLSLRNNQLWCQRQSLEKAIMQNDRIVALSPPLALIDEQAKISQENVTLFAQAEGKEKIGDLVLDSKITILGEAEQTFKNNTEQAHAFLIRATTGQVGWIVVKDGKPPFVSDNSRPWGCAASQ